MTTPNTKVECVLNSLIRNYFKGSLLFSVQPEDAELMTWATQRAFLDATVHSELLKRYPVKNEFSKLFFKKLINFLEPYQEVHDDIYEFLCAAMKSESSDMFCYRHYVIGFDLQDIITIKETNNMVVNGTTGMRTWEAALMLADWALCNKNAFLHKNVLELGSGVGFTGITIAKHCKIKSLVLTDCHEDVLKAINENISINFHEYINANDNDMIEEERNSRPNIDAMMLDWNDDDEIPSCLVPDIVIGADIVYDPSILQPLCNVLERLFDRNVELEVYIASVIRNEDTFNDFLRILEKNDLSFCKISLECSKFIDWDYNNEQRCLLKIIRKNKNIILYERLLVSAPVSQPQISTFRHMR
ncbi:protein-lysine N-methyltransferase EEF2KMT [Leguminivora glycinivorella]|uniref:protein-lysine N-methyltransferase EEF2KMT n=1 Tax=Leguminivora glycinivorella TaxID=1035111 RepID=UPI00200D3B67|nr:protein-lysine N-methyltransferase EEF2KMT [Leguminivora glycinivorella]